MGLKNCPECGRLFVENVSGLCPACYQQVEEDEFKVVDYLRDRNKASLQQIHEATGVKESIIMRMLRRGRLFSDLEITYPCETCGGPITEGRLCSQCSKGFLDQVAESAKKTVQSNPTYKTHERMYTNEFDKNKK